MKKCVLASQNFVAAAVAALMTLPAMAGQIHSAPKTKPRVAHYHAPHVVVVPSAHARSAHIAHQSHSVVTKSVAHGPTGITVAVSTPIRTGPSDAAAIVKRVPAGTPIPNILGEQNGFYEYVRYTNQHAWVAAADLQIGGMPPPITSTPPILTKPQATTKSSDSDGHRWGTSIAAESAILEAPSADAKVIKTIPAGTHVPAIIGEQNGFYEYIRWTHKTAWIAVSDVRLGGGPDVASASAGDEAPPVK